MHYTWAQMEGSGQAGALKALSRSVRQPLAAEKPPRQKLLLYRFLLPGNSDQAFFQLLQLHQASQCPCLLFWQHFWLLLQESLPGVMLIRWMESVGSSGSQMLETPESGTTI